MASIQTGKQPKQQDGARILVEKARTGCHDELRQSRRFPFFQPVTIDTREAGATCLSAFSRDISAWGIGLLLNSPLKLQMVNLKIHFGEDEDVSVAGFVRWCQPCGQGWYLAGISFNDSSCDELGYMIGGFVG